MVLYTPSIHVLGYAHSEEVKVEFDLPRCLARGFARCFNVIGPLKATHPPTPSPGTPRHSLQSAFTQEDIIIAVQNRPALWDKRHKQHHNRHVLDKEWKEIAKELKVTAARRRARRRGKTSCTIRCYLHLYLHLHLHIQLHLHLHLLTMRVPLCFSSTSCLTISSRLSVDQILIVRFCSIALEATPVFIVTSNYRRGENLIVDLFGFTSLQFLHILQ
ncbi:hypothetical protein J6590_063302 [Homalodisca vitripennis]|nr:hypothetical protein J6590_063302 [Homalodisca vitripennis]